jgi:S1/P1 Nuclease
MKAVKNQNDPERRAIALAWLFHLVGDIHQPSHTAQLFTVDYPSVTGAGMKSVSGFPSDYSIRAATMAAGFF